MKTDIQTADGRYDSCSEIFYDIENELKAKLKIDCEDWYLQEALSADLMFDWFEEIVSHDKIHNIAYDLIVRECIYREIAHGIKHDLKKYAEENNIDSEFDEIFANLESLQKQGNILRSVYDDIHSRPIYFETVEVTEVKS